MMSQSKHVKHSNQAGIVNSETADRITELPANLRSHILSFLPTRCAVSTSILSKKWRYVWTLVPVLDFTDLPSSMKNEDMIVFNQAQFATFTNFVNRILLHNCAPSLKRLHFEAYEGFVSRHVFEWMFAICRRCVQELCLIININLCMSLPESFLLGKEKLVVLILESVTFKLPSSFHLPCLRSLSLRNVIFENEDDTLDDDCWIILLSSCPVLEELNVDLDNLLMPLYLANVSVYSSSIKILRIVLPKKQKRAIFLETPNLEVLHLSAGNMLSNVNDLSLLVEARLEIQTSSVRWIKLLHRICYTTILVLHQIVLDVSTSFLSFYLQQKLFAYGSSLRDYHPNTKTDCIFERLQGSSAYMKLSVFGNLTHLEAGFTAWPIVLQIIKHAPKLVSLILHKLMFGWPDNKPRKKELPLERIEYHGFNVEEGFEVVEHFLSNCTQLKEFRIYTYSWVDSMAKIEILTKLLKLHRVSNQCKIIVVNEDYKSKSEDSDNEAEGWISDATTSTSLEDEDEDSSWGL